MPENAPPPSERRSLTSAIAPLRRRRWLFIAIIALVSFFLFIILLDNVIMPLYVKRGAKATVPPVVGMKTDSAVSKLKDAGYEPIQYEVRFDDKAKEGTIIRQTPEAGEETKPGRKVYLIISGGKEMAVVPDLRGKSLRDAKMALLKANMPPGNVSYAYSDSATNGTVFQQTPAPGTKTTTNTQVNIVVSQGALVGRVPAPALTGMTLSQAIEKIKSVKLELGKVTYESGTPENTVLEQYPPSGDLLNEGASIDVFVARGGGAPPPPGQ